MSVERFLGWFLVIIVSAMGLFLGTKMSFEGFLGWFLVTVVLAISLFFVFSSFFKVKDGTKDLEYDAIRASHGTLLVVLIMFLFSSFFNTSVVTNELVPLNTSNNSSGEMFISFVNGTAGLGELKDALVIKYIEKTNDDTLNFTIDTINAELAEISYINEGESPYIEKTCGNPLGMKSENCFRLIEVTFHVTEGSISNETDVKI